MSLSGAPNSIVGVEATRALARSLHDRASARTRYVLSVLLIAGVYTGCGKLGLDLAYATSSVTAIWPPTGIALSVLVLGGYRLWPAVALGALLTNIDTGVPAFTVAGITCGNTLEALAGAYLLRGVGFRPSLQRVRDVFALVALGAVLSTIVSATIGVASLLASGSVSIAHAASVWRTWWLGDMGGDLIVAPVLLLAVTQRPFKNAPGRLLEALALVCLLGGVSVLVFTHSIGITYAVFPLLIWAALRFWQPGAAVASLIVASVAVAFTANGEGPFAHSGPDDRLLLAQTFAAVAGITALVLAVVTSAVRRAEQAEHNIAQRLQHDLGPDPVPRIPGWQVATFYHPASALGVEVGGDFFDFFPTDAGWIVLLGDVTGKGVEAAAMTALMRHGARVASQLGEGPGAILSRLDEALRQQPKLSLCTALCARLREREVVISAAGHPPPLLVGDDGKISELDGGGPLLGLDEGGYWPERAAQVTGRETLLFYTDGVTDTRGEAERFGDGRLREVLAAQAGRAPASLLAELESALEEFQFGAHDDDTAALALRAERASAAGRLRGRSFASRRER
jgi:integral membrane sensor domain MASE1